MQTHVLREVDIWGRKGNENDDQGCLWNVREVEKVGNTEFGLKQCVYSHDILHFSHILPSSPRCLHLLSYNYKKSYSKALLSKNDRKS